MFTTDGAVPSFYAERGVIGGCLRIATALGVEPMRALQMATIDPRPSSASTRNWAASRPGDSDAQLAAGDWRVAAGAGARDGRIVARDGEFLARSRARLAGGPGLVAPDAAFAPLTGIQPVARYESAVINRRVDRDAAPGCCRPRWSAATAPGSPRA